MMPSTLGRSGWIYFAQARNGGPVKIGFAADPAKRMQHLQVGSPAKLWFVGKKPGTQEQERALHVLAHSEHSHGEWFRATERLEEIITAELGRRPSRLRLGKLEQGDTIHPGALLEQLCKLCLGAKDEQEVVRELIVGICYHCAKRLWGYHEAGELFRAERARRDAMVERIEVPRRMRGTREQQICRECKQWLIRAEEIYFHECPGPSAVEVEQPQPEPVRRPRHSRRVRQGPSHECRKCKQRVPGSLGEHFAACQGNGGGG